MSESLPPHELPPAASVNLTDQITIDQLNSDGVTYTLRGAAITLLAEALVQTIVIGGKIRSGIGAPPEGVGNAGDFYIDHNAWAIYGPRRHGSWGPAVPLVGPQGSAGAAGPAGPSGNTILSGVEPPNVNQGRDGDLYVQNLGANGVNLYGPKESGAWPPPVSLSSGMPAIFTNPSTISDDLTIAAGYNAAVFGPVSVTGVITVPPSSTFRII